MKRIFLGVEKRARVGASTAHKNTRFRTFLLQKSSATRINVDLGADP